MVGLPLFADQPKNAKHLEMAGIGRIIQWNELSVERLTDAISDVISDVR